ncbi:MAG: polysaccharide deacetylase family protein [Candidatus Sulfotelmatobacter sp.]
MNRRRLLIHADDFGLCKSVNRAVAEAFETGAITAASIMMPCPAAEEAVQLSMAHPEWDVGIHLTLTSEWDGLRWGPVASRSLVPSLIDEEGFFWKDISLFTSHAVPSEISIEVDAQLKRAYELGLRPTHIDCHMYSLFRSGALFRIYCAAADQWSLPALGKRMPAAPSTFFTLPARSRIDEFPSLYGRIVAKNWRDVAQLTIHPGHDTPELRSITRDTISWGAEWRQADLAAISSKGFRNALAEAGIQPVGWRVL